VNLGQDGTSLFLLLAKSGFPAVSEGQETAPGTVFEIQWPIFVIFNNTYPEMTNYIVRIN
jgi:hypothetical protein